VDKVFPGLHEDLHGNVFRNAAVFDKPSHEGELCIGGGWEADFNFLKTSTHQRIKELQLLGDVHRYRERLVAIAQIDAAPEGRVG
jgi:hypothetical protein